MRAVYLLNMRERRFWALIRAFMLAPSGSPEEQAALDALTGRGRT